MKQVYKVKAISGQSIIEVLVAFGVIVILGIALVSAGLLTQRTSISARNNTQATKLAQGYLEQVRVIRDVMGATAFNSVASGCYTISNSGNSDPAQWGLSSGCVGTSPCNAASPYNGELVQLNNVNFCRKITLANLVGLGRTVTVDVTWKEGVNDRTITANTVLAKWCEGMINGTASPCP